jgi:carboxyl-terminal processing protease
VKESYIDPQRFNPREMFEKALDHVQREVPEVMVTWSDARDAVTVRVGDKTERFPVGPMTSLFHVSLGLRDVFRFMQAHHRGDDDDLAEIEYAAINGMLSTLDPHSNLLSPRVYRDMRVGTRGEFGGLGIMISLRDGQLTVISPLEDTPAFRAGVRPKDRIVRINDESTAGMTLEEAVTRLRGTPGTSVTIWVMRSTWSEPRRFEITRGHIVIRSVESQLLAEDVGYVKIKNFQENTFDDLTRHLQDLKDRAKTPGGRLRGLVLDLRNNPGGLLDQAIKVGDAFLDQGLVVSTVGQGARWREDKRAHRAGTEPGYPMAVLVSAGSASASEIVAGALKHQGRAVVVGQQTFGKGSVQVLYEYADGSALKLTTAQWLAGGELSIQSVGITPDLLTIPVVLEKDDVALNIAEQILREEDLERHFEFSDAHASEEPRLKLKYLQEVEKEGGEDDGDGGGGGDAPVFREDFEIRLAAELLRGARAADRSEILAGAGPQVDAAREREEARIAAALRRLGIDWSAGVAAADALPELSVRHALVGDTPPLTAGDEARLRVEVANGGRGPAYQVSVVSHAESSLFDNRELLFGRIDPGQTRAWEVAIKVPESTWRHGEPVELSVLEQHGRVPAPTTMDVQVEALPRPAFAHAWHIEDAPPGGNGDGLLQKGETFDLVVRVRNVGEGAARTAVASIKNESGKGLFIEDGREALDALAVGADALARFQVWAKASLTGQEARVVLSVGDATLMEEASATIRIPLTFANALPVKAARGLVRAATGAVEVRAGASHHTPVLATLPRGGSVAVVGTLPGWTRVALAEGLHGFVPDGEGARANAGRPQGAAQFALAVKPPVVAATLRPEVTITDADVVALGGAATDDARLRDVFVFVNDDKVFYAAGAVASGVEPARVPFQLDLHLDEGLNEIKVYAREDEELVSRRLMFVFRRKTSRTASRAEARPAAPEVRPQ